MKPILALLALLAVLPSALAGVPALVGASVAGAQASELRMTVERPRFTCEGRGRLLSHVAYVPGDAEPDGNGRGPSDDAPLPCCDGQIGCAQFLSTSTVLRPDRPLRG